MSKKIGGFTRNHCIVFLAILSHQDVKINKIEFVTSEKVALHWYLSLPFVHHLWGVSKPTHSRTAETVRALSAVICSVNLSAASLLYSQVVLLMCAVFEFSTPQQKFCDAQCWCWLQLCRYALCSVGVYVRFYLMLSVGRRVNFLQCTASVAQFSHGWPCAGICQLVICYYYCSISSSVSLLLTFSLRWGDQTDYQTNLPLAASVVVVWPCHTNTQWKAAQL